MHDLHPLRAPSLDDERTRRRLEDDQDEETALQERLERASEHASLPFSHPAVHRLARRERSRRRGLTDDRDAA
jgi:hypothetical protein